VTDGKWDYGTWVQKRSVQSQLKREGVDIRRSTDGQTPKRKELIFGEVQTDKPQKGKSLSLTKVQTNKS